jgi:hypothetical protein
MKYRIGKKQNRALLTEDGKEVALFAKGQEEVAATSCKLLNLQAHIDLLLLNIEQFVPEENPLRHSNTYRQLKQELI